MTLTIFTPTYNRAHMLPDLYKSLLEQSNKDFEWIVVDDGGSDNTEALMQKLIAEGQVRIIFEKQINSGKHIAVNRGVQLASGTLFVNLDSDDIMAPEAVEKIIAQWNQLLTVPDFDSFGGLAGNKAYTDGKKVGSELDYKILDTTIIDFRFNRGIKGDKMEVFKTELIRQYPFPVNGEKFCPEALVWNRIGSRYKFRFFNDTIYIGEYLPGGLSDRIISIRKKSPDNASTYYAELTQYDIPFKEKIKAGINYWRFCIYNKSKSLSQKIKAVSIWLTIVTLPLGLLMAVKDRKH